MARTVGVIGGMGPAATVEFLVRLVRATPATRDEDHLHVIVDSDPAVPSRTAAILEGGPSPAPRLCAMARGLERAGAEVLVMPCNTAHAFIDAIRAAVEIPVLDMLAETAARLETDLVGLLATGAVVRAGLYDRAFLARDVRWLVPEAGDQAEITRLIAAVKAGESLDALRPRLRVIVSHLAERGAKSIVVGCTEISLLHDAGSSLPGVDALDCLVEATIREARA